MERELEQRLQIQKDILKTKYKQKLSEELARYTSRSNADNTQKANESFENKLKEFEAKHQELHQRILEAEKRVMETPLTKFDSISKHPDRGTQTSTDTITKLMKTSVDTQGELQQMVKTISEQERQVDHIVFDAKLRIQELEHESNQLDRGFRDYLERQRAEKQKMRENATSIWKSYALGKYMLDKKCATLRSTATTMGKHPVTATTPVVVFDDNPPPLSIPTINIDTSVSASQPAFENPFRSVQRKVLARSKTLPLPLLSTDTESSAEKHTRHQCRQRPSVFRMNEHIDENRTKVVQPPSLSPCRPVPNKIPAAAQLSPELNIKDITLDGIEISPTTAKSSSLQSGESNGNSSNSPRGVFKLRRQLFTATTDNGGPSSSNGNKEAEEPLKQINKDRKKSIDGNGKNVDVNKEMQVMKGDQRQGSDGNITFEVHSEGPRGNKLDVPSDGVEEDVSSQSSRISTGGARALKEFDNEFRG